ncbi:MAG: glutamate decarboxylase, partial [Deltaproteobacteria bacterium]|nr:glutamate decarboxylase [Deltaproteobacteria bacterium]
SFVSRTRLESTRYAPRKIVVLRAITVNPNTEPYMLRKVLNEHRSMGIRIWEEIKDSIDTEQICRVS